MVAFLVFRGGDSTDPVNTSSTDSVNTSSTGNPAATTTFSDMLRTTGQIHDRSYPMVAGEAIRVVVTPSSTLEPVVGLAVRATPETAELFTDFYGGLSEVSGLFENFFSDEPSFDYRNPEPFVGRFGYIIASSDGAYPTETLAGGNTHSPGHIAWLQFIAPFDGTYTLLIHGEDQTTGAYEAMVETRKPPADLVKGNTFDESGVASLDDTSIDKVVEYHRPFFDDARFFPSSKLFSDYFSDGNTDPCDYYGPERLGPLKPQSC